MTPVVLTIEQIKRLIKEAYEIGYTDRECNHINDSDTYTEEVIYLLSEMIEREEKKIHY